MKAEEKRAKFLSKAEISKLNFEIHQKLKEEFFKEVDHLDLKVIYEQGFIDDVFILSLISYAEAYHKEKVNEDLADDLIHNLRKMSYSEDYIQGVLNAKRILLM